MANRALFETSRGPLPRETDVRNAEGAGAYGFSEKHALAQYAATGCLNATFYADADLQLDTVLALAAKVEPLFVAKTAVFARERPDRAVSAACDRAVRATLAVGLPRALS